MIASLLLAVVIGQLGDPPKTKHPHPPIDRLYTPKVGDRALLGTWNMVSPELTINRAWCYSTIERARQSYENGAEIDGDPVVSAEPDAYIPRAGTPVLVKELSVLTYADTNGKTRAYVAKVQILEGEFTGREFFVSPVFCFRFQGDTNLAVREKAKTKKRSGRRPAPAAIPDDTQLVLTDLAVNEGPIPNFTKVDGRVRCTSSETLKGIFVTVRFEDRNGKMIRSVEGIITPNALTNGEIGSFEVYGATDSRNHKIKVSFNDYKKNLVWADQSGMNAHE